MTEQIPVFLGYYFFVSLSILREKLRQRRANIECEWKITFNTWRKWSNKDPIPDKRLPITLLLVGRGAFRPALPDNC